MKDLLRQASARLAYQEGVVTLQEDPVTAERSFEIARLTDPALQETVQPYLDQIAAWKRQTAAVQGLLAEAEKLERSDMLAEAYKTLSAAKEAFVSDWYLRSNTVEHWIAVRIAWRQRLFQELAAIPADSGRTAEIIDLLRSENLLDSGDDFQTLAAAEKARYRAQATKAAHAKPPRWEDAIRAWTSYLEIDADDIEAQEGLQAAQREATLVEARRTFIAASRENMAAFDLPAIQAQGDRLQIDPLFLAELVSLAFQYGAAVLRRQATLAPQRDAQ
jgi:hypothetical protein